MSIVHFQSGKWRPTQWEDIAGNHQLKQYWHDLIRTVRIEHRNSCLNALIMGGTGEGKTSTIQYGLKCLGCNNLDYSTFNACGRCTHCSDRNELWGNYGWENVVELMEPEGERERMSYHYSNVDCPRVTESDLEDILGRLVDCATKLRVVYFDEVHALSRRLMDERLLKTMDDFEVIWIASSAYIEAQQKRRPKLERMFLKRFDYRLETEKPPMEELVEWLAKRCLEFGIQVEDPKQNLRLLANLSERVVRNALQILYKARNSEKRLLTADLIRQHNFLN